MENNAVFQAVMDRMLELVRNLFLERATPNFMLNKASMREHSHSYATEEQRNSGQNLARVARKLNSEQALIFNPYFITRKTLTFALFHTLNK
jgi:hypothetical protein